MLAITLNYSKFYSVLDSVRFVLLWPASFSAHGSLSVAARPNDVLVGQQGWGGRGSVRRCNGQLRRPPLQSQRRKARRHDTRRTKRIVALPHLSCSLVIYHAPPRLLRLRRWTSKKEKRRRRRKGHYIIVLSPCCASTYCVYLKVITFKS